MEDVAEGLSGLNGGSGARYILREPVGGGGGTSKSSAVPGDLREASKGFVQWSNQCGWLCQRPQLESQGAQMVEIISLDPQAGEVPSKGGPVEDGIVTATRTLLSAFGGAQQQFADVADALNVFAQRFVQSGDEE